MDTEPGNRKMRLPSQRAITGKSTGTRASASASEGLGVESATGSIIEPRSQRGGVGGGGLGEGRRRGRQR